ncbi:hypothetical protein H5410_021810 [Solanum commersonii]|uniref:Uncharacterized protein n=1 Tax=Solanum commersonii TaxID=4109 RepID=A0A9J5ZCE8_SOLCO|nr:hypothetical protein H5410_021810 [Solanum commersonii]
MSVLGRYFKEYRPPEVGISRSLSEKQDILWVKWVHGLYMRNDVSIWEHTLPQDCSWYWKKLNALKNNMRNWYIQGRYALTHSGQYSISASYNAMLGEMNKLRIADLIWTSVAQPKHRMIMCQVMETQLYLFAHCAWLGQVKAEIFSWDGLQVYPSEPFLANTLKCCWYGASKEEIDDIITNGFLQSSYPHGVQLSPYDYPLDGLQTAIQDKDGLSHLLIC